MIQKGQHRNGQHGHLAAPFDANGFAEFVSDTGARFTIHSMEFSKDLSERPTPNLNATYYESVRQRWHGMPKGCLHFRVKRTPGGPELEVMRTGSVA